MIIVESKWVNICKVIRMVTGTWEAYCPRLRVEETEALKILCKATQLSYGTARFLSASCLVLAPSPAPPSALLSAVV